MLLISSKLLSLALGKDSSKSVDHSQDVQEKRHGTDQQCMSCHYKLDPAGNTFRTSGLILNPWPAAGGLVFICPKYPVGAGLPQAFCAAPELELWDPSSGWPEDSAGDVGRG